MDGSQAAAAGLGHNQPPSDIEILLDKLAAAHKPLLDRATDLVGALERVPSTIADEATCGRASDFIKQLTAAVKNAEAARVAEKEPHLAAGKAVDGFFQRLAKQLGDAKDAVQARITTYLRAKEAEERRRRDEAARLAREEAARLEREAMAAAQDPVLAPMAAAALDEAVLAETVAAERTAAAKEKPAELARSRSDYGSVATLRTVWVGEIVDYAKVDLEKLRPYLARADVEKAVRAFVKIGGRELAGVKIEQQSDSVVS